MFLKFWEIKNIELRIKMYINGLFYFGKELSEYTLM